ncbi:unnamed protein product [Paramecium pentaurelia]|uniref:EF-hand domain-containing protein n=1 Tax=Paramecium pentaurelia TaxID=43138 RepID=A0A8S1U685_9CILI|nr:unnamed protein product [Paramecium pentaurelia]
MQPKKSFVALAPGPIKFNIKSYERPGFTEEEIKEIKEAFDIFDEDGGGEIDPRELKTVMASLGFAADEQLLNNLIEIAQTNKKDGKIDFDEFLDLMTVRLSDIKSKENLKEVFDLLKPNEKGCLELESLKQICREVGENIDENELNEMLKRADFDKDDMVNFEDFYKIITYQK